MTYEGRPIRFTADFSPETMKARRSWADVIQTLREHKCQPKLLYPAKLSINIDGETKIFQDKIRRSNLRIICIEESENSQLKGPVTVFNKII